jgi:hypothetical protein
MAKRTLRKWEDLADRIWSGRCENCGDHSDNNAEYEYEYLIDGLCDQCHKNPFLFFSGARNNCHPIVREFGQWAVTTYGVECIDRGGDIYVIEKDRLDDPDPRYGWVKHMAEKDWVCVSDFAAALKYARQHHKAGVR